MAGMEHLQSQRLEVANAIKEEEAERVRIEQDMAVLQSRLAHIKESLHKKVTAFCPQKGRRPDVRHGPLHYRFCWAQGKPLQCC